MPDEQRRPTVPEDVRAAARWLADQPLTLPPHVADHLDVVLAFVLGHTTRTEPK